MPKFRPFLSDFVFRVLLPSLIAAGSIATLLMYIVHGIFDETNRLDASYARNSAQSVLKSAREDLETVANDNAIWDDAVAHVYGKPGDAWLMTTWGATTALGTFDAAYVVESDGRTVFGAHDGVATSIAATARYGHDIENLLKASQTDTNGLATVSGIVKRDDKLNIVAVAPIVPANLDLGVHAATPRFLILVKQMDQRMLSSLSQRFVLSDLKIITENITTSDMVAILSPSGERIGALVWSDRNPGEVLRGKYGNVVSVILGLFLFVIAVLIYTSWKGFRDAHRSQADAIAKSLRDDLTGLANRRELLSVLTGCLSQAKQDGIGLSVVYADLDGFKEVNDSYGHEIGDMLLKSAAAGFAHLSKDACLVARLGGDEFAMIVKGPDNAEKSRTLARNMIAFLEEPMIFAGRVASVSVSVGIVDMDKDDADVEEMIRRADVAMYAAKGAGRNRLHVYERSLDYKRDENRAIAKALREHIDHGSLTVVYQPIVDARTRRIRGVEALVRWPANARVYYTPDVFIPVAEEFGLIEDLGYFVLSEACRQAAQWPDIFVAVNVSPIQFMNPGFADLVEKTLIRTGLPATRLEVEVTEGFIIDNAERANAIINRLHDMRVGVALDDFGTGFSSIGHLRRFKFDKLKLDRSMVMDILSQPSALRLVQGTIAMADALGLVVVAEGIEDENQVSVLRLAGCSQFQGYLFSRPVEPAKITDILMPDAMRAAV